MAKALFEWDYSEFLCEDCNECNCICPDNAITIPLDKATFYSTIELQVYLTPAIRKWIRPE